MQIGNTETAWGAVQRVLHWTLAVTVLAQLVGGDVMLFTSSEQVPALWYYIHPTVGILIGVFMLGRFAWRSRNPVPAVPQDISVGKQVASQATHLAFYFLLICNPVIGWLLVGAMGEQVFFFNAWLPNLMGPSSFYEPFYFWLHMAFAGAIGGLFLLHAGAALQHEFLKRDNVLRRMLGFPPMTPERQAIQDDPGERDQWAAERHSALAAWVKRESSDRV